MVNNAKLKGKRVKFHLLPDPPQVHSSYFVKILISNFLLESCLHFQRRRRDKERPIKGENCLGGSKGRVFKVRLLGVKAKIYPFIS